MARIAGVDLPREKKVDVGLTYIYGVGQNRAQWLVKQAQIDTRKRVRELSEEEVNRLNALIAQHFKVEGELRREVQQNIRRLVEIGCYRGLRHKARLPARGQRTRSNARTRKGPRKTIGTGKGPPPKK